MMRIQMAFDMAQNPPAFITGGLYNIYSQLLGGRFHGTCPFS
jgi:hypothetical protein